MFTRLLSIVGMVLILSFSLSANAQPAQVRAGARVFIAPMESGLNNFLAAEIIKKKVPIVVVMDEAQADYILSGFSAKTGEGKWYDVMFSTPKDKNEGSVQLVSVSTNSLVWAGEAGDRSLWWGELKRSGQRKVADRIVSKMKKDLFKDYKWDGGHGAEAILNESSRSAQPQVESSSTSDQSKPCYQNGRKVACP